MKTKIEQEMNVLRQQRWLKDMEGVYNMLQNVVKEEYDTTLEQFLMDYYGLKKELDKIKAEDIVPLKDVDLDEWFKF